MIALEDVLQIKLDFARSLARSHITIEAQDRIDQSKGLNLDPISLRVSHLRIYLIKVCDRPSQRQIRDDEVVAACVTCKSVMITIRWDSITCDANKRREMCFGHGTHYKGDSQDGGKEQCWFVGRIPVFQYNPVNSRTTYHLRRPRIPLANYIDIRAPDRFNREAPYISIAPKRDTGSNSGYNRRGAKARKILKQPIGCMPSSADLK